MRRYAALLRAINVGGRTVKMERLRSIFTDAGFRAVETVIASGNVLFDAAAQEAAAIEALLETRLAAGLGFAVSTFIRSPAELAAVAEEATALDLRALRSSTSPAVPLMVVFLKREPGPAETTRALELSSPGEEIRVRGRELYWLRPADGASSLSPARLERALGMPGTARNISTVRRISDKLTSSA